jgi:hypothetical protein
MPARPPHGRRFVKGQSGNPGGRPKAALDIQTLARQHTPDAIAALVAALASPKERVSAAVALLDRGWGRPTAFIAGDSSAAPLAIDFRWADATPAQSAPEPELISDAGGIDVVFAAGTC